jgi:hypothetical protein
MSPCCVAAATLTAALTALAAVGLTGFVLVTDGFGLGLLSSTLLALALQWAGLVGPCPRLLECQSALLVARALWLLTTTRRPLVVATWLCARRVASRVAGRLRRPLRVPRAAVRPPHCGRARGCRAQCAESQ